MKSNYFVLLKAGLAYTFASSKFGMNAKTKGKKAALACLFAFLGLYLAGISAFFTAFFYDMLCEAGLKMLIPSMFATASALLSLISALFTSAGFLFKAKDLPVLFPLPVSHRTVLAVKFTLFYLSEVLISFISLGVAMTTFFILDGVTPMALITGVAGIFIVPLLPMGIGVAIAFGVGMLIRNFRHKNQITTILTVAASVALVMFFYMGNTSEPEQILATAKAITDKISSVYFPTALFVNAFQGDILSLVFFAALNILPPAILILLISPRYSALVASFNSENTRTDFKYTAGRSGKPFGTFLYKEIKRVLSSANYILNSCSSMLMLGMYCILSFRLKNLPYEIFDGDPELAQNILYLAISWLILLSCGFTSTSTSSISLEAKTLWILRSAPVNMKTIFDAKALANTVIQFPVAVIAITIISIIMGFSLLKSLLLYALGTIVMLAASYAGLVLNLLMPKLNWQNETQVIKQSAAAGLYILFAMVLSTLVGGLAVLGLLFLHLDAVTLVVGFISIYIFLFLLFRRLSHGWGVRKFQKIY